jgi:hypothetical protein
MQPYLDSVVRKVQSGEWKGGLELEFAARVLEAQPPGK